MRIAHAPSQLERRPRAVAIGTFDGVHLGHRSVLRSAIDSGLEPTVITFDPHPRIAMGNRVDTLTTLERRLELAYADSPAALEGLPPLPAAPTKPRRRWGRRHGERDTAEPGWVPTTERFVDPTTGSVMRVWVDPADRSRHYVPDASELP